MVLLKKTFHSGIQVTSWNKEYTSRTGTMPRGFTVYQSDKQARLSPPSSMQRNRTAASPGAARGGSAGEVLLPLPGFRSNYRRHFACRSEEPR
jgi:hypothetical protein